MRPLFLRLVVMGVLSAAALCFMRLWEHRPAAAQTAFSPPWILAGNANKSRALVYAFTAERRGSETTPYRRSKLIRPFGTRRVSVSVSGGDLNGDKVPEVICAIGAGQAPLIRTADGRTLTLFTGVFGQFNPFDRSDLGGVNVALGDVDGDRRPDLVTAVASEGVPEVLVFSGNTGAQIRGFLAFGSGVRAGVRVAAGDLDGDGKADLITGTGPGGAPHLNVFSGADLRLIYTAIVFDGGFTGGIHVASGDLTGDGKADIIVGSGAGARGHIQAFDGATFGVIRNFQAFPSEYTGGVSVAAGDINGDGKAEIVAGTASRANEVRIFGQGGEIIQRFRPFPGKYRGGVNVAVAR